MFTHKIVLNTLFLVLLGTQLMVASLTKKDLSEVNGSWQLRVLDSHDVRRQRANIDFHGKQMIINGFDGCNRISAHLKTQGNTVFYAKLHSSHMACRTSAHRYVSKRVKQTVKEGFTITKTKRYGIDGITVRSKHHDLFFKKMGGTDSIFDSLK